jgi:spore maturation protein CgeB
MKILLGGFLGDGTSESFALSAFRETGAEVLFFDFSQYRQSLFNRAVNKLRRTPAYFGTGALNAKLLEEATRFKPDLTFLFKPVLINPKTVVRLKDEVRCKVFSWYPDYVRFPKTASVFFYASIPLYDCHFSYNFANAEELKKWGAQRSIFLPCAADPTYHAPVPVSDAERKHFGSDVAFIGTYAKEKRSEYLERLCADGYDLKVWGNNWEKCPTDQCLIRTGKVQFKAVLGPDMSKVMNASKINLAFVRNHNNETLACRTYEIPACGGFLLHERTAKTGEVFQEGTEAEFFSSYEEMRAKIDVYLADDARRRKVAEAGRKKVLEGGHLFVNRVRIIIEVFKALS